MHCNEGWTVCLVEQVDVLDDSSEGLPVSLVIDGRRASMIILGHLVDVNGSVGWSDEACFRFALFVGQTERRRL